MTQRGNASAATEDDRALVEAFVRATAHMGGLEVEASADISRESLRLYREGSWKRLTAAQRRKLRAFLEQPLAPSAGYIEGLETAIAALERTLAELKAQLAAARAAQGDEKA